MKILVTGAKGFIGKNLVVELKNRGYNHILEFDRETDIACLEEYTSICDFVFNLAGVNRSNDEKEFMRGNYDFTAKLLELLKKHSNKAPVLVTSSIQATLNNPYGESKAYAEKLLFDYSKENQVNTYIYRLPNVFGKWSKPNYNTVVATYCHNISRGLDIKINNPKAMLRLCYIDDVVKQFINALEGKPTIHENYCTVSPSYMIELGELANKIIRFNKSRESLILPDMNDDLTRKLYSTYLSFLPKDDFAYSLKMNEDARGSFTEFFRTTGNGQVSINVCKPNITKGNHWHHTKNEKFLVVKGEGIIRFRKIDDYEIIEYRVTGENLQVIDIPVGYAHSIVNTGESELITVIWSSESFDPKNSDTYFMEV